MPNLDKNDIPVLFEPCKDWSSCPNRNDRPDMSYSEWVDYYCGSCPDRVFIDQSCVLPKYKMKELVL